MKQRKRVPFLLIILAAFVLMAGPFPSISQNFISDTACAAELTLAWDANLESNLAGYRLYYENEKDDDFYGGTDANEGDSPITIHLIRLTDPDSPSYTVSGLEEGTYYYFALTAFDKDGMESDFSDEVGAMAQKGESDSESSGSGSGIGNGSGSGCFIGSALGHRFQLGGIIAAVVVLLGVSILRFFISIYLRQKKLLILETNTFTAIQNKKSRG